jgi:hypothetical protein
MDHTISRDRFEFEGREFEMAIFADDDNGPPWERSDGHGPVRYAEDSERLQRGETVLYELRRGRYVYDMGAAILQASREKWGLDAASMETLAKVYAPKRPTKSQIRMTAIKKDMQYLRGWCAEDWGYIGVSVRIIGPDDEPIGDDYSHAIWGIESSSNDYSHEVAHDLARDILHERATVWREALREARARRYWASRDVETVGA